MFPVECLFEKVLTEVSCRFCSWRRPLGEGNWLQSCGAFGSSEFQQRQEGHSVCFTFSRILDAFLMLFATSTKVASYKWFPFVFAISVLK